VLGLEIGEGLLEAITHGWKKQGDVQNQVEDLAFANVVVLFVSVLVLDLVQIFDVGVKQNLDLVLDTVQQKIESFGVT
jgi:hypothetical protein